MAPGKAAVDFNVIINQDRQRRKNEALAQEIFGKNRRASAPGAGAASRKAGTGPSLASRIGIQKRTISSSTKLPRQNIKPAPGNVDAEWTHDLHTLNNPSASRIVQIPTGPRGKRPTRAERIQGALNGSVSTPNLNSQFNIVAPKPSPGISIRGIAGPYVVMAKNFAIGTSAADIESAMTPVGGVCLSCRLIAERPSVIAEIVFETKEGADNVVETFNNQNADGQLLHVYHKIGASPSTTRMLNAQNSSQKSAPRSVTPLGPRADTHDTSNHHALRDRSRDQGRDYDRDGVMDGSYGFEDRMDTDIDNQDEKGRSRGALYSDSMVNNRNGRDRGRHNERGRGFR